MNNRVSSGYVLAGVVKLIAYFLLYQFVFVYLGVFCAFFAYKEHVAPVSFDEFTALASPEALRYNTMGTAVGMFLSSLAMILHLLLFKYVKISRSFFREVGHSVLVFSLLFIGCMMVAFNITASWLGLENNLETMFEQMFGNGFGVLSMAVLAPVLEELLFRGAIQGTLMRTFRNPWVGIVVASLLFGIIHWNPVQVFYATCLGMGFGWVYYRTGSLLPVILGHSINNSLAVLGGLLFGAGADAQATGTASADASMVVVALVLMIVLGRAIDRLQPAVPVPWRGVGDAE